MTKGGRLILNSAFPRALLPLSAVITAFMRFLPTIVIYIPVHIASGLPVNANLLWVDPDRRAVRPARLRPRRCWSPPRQVYFRDLSNFLPYVLRIWLYVSPVLYYADEVPGPLQVAPRRQPARRPADRVERRAQPPATRRRPWSMLLGLAWGIGIFVAAGLFFLSREREFAVRL